MNTPGTDRNAQPASIYCTACQGAILVEDGQYHVGVRSYHPDCYDRLRAQTLVAAGLSPEPSRLGSGQRVQVT
jgi:hypothetical protein